MDYRVMQGGGVVGLLLADEYGVEISGVHVLVQLDVAEQIVPILPAQDGAEEETGTSISRP
jgi:hypothetical protein